ncbi:Arm DNA-binding domain-containing protein [Desulfovibrio psychrotolerans]
MYRITDSDGLCLEVPPKGKKRWRFRYIFAGKRGMLSLGTYPEISLQEVERKETTFVSWLPRG